MGFRVTGMDMLFAAQDIAREPPRSELRGRDLERPIAVPLPEPDDPGEHSESAGSHRLGLRRRRARAERAHSPE